MAIPRIGIGVFVFNEHRQLLLGLRKGSHGAGTLALPGGHLEFTESFAHCAAREVLEETGLIVDHVRFLTATNSIFRDDDRQLHYVTIFMGARIKVGSPSEAKVIETEKCEGWQWVAWSEVEGLAQVQLGGVDVEGQEGRKERRLFEPLVGLLQQRMGLDPYTAWDERVDENE